MSRPRPGEHRVEATTPKRKSRRNRDAVQSDALGMADALRINEADHERTVERGIERGTEKGRLHARMAVARFEQYLDASGTDLDEVAVSLGRGRSRLHAVYVLAYASQIAVPGHIQPRSHSDELSKLLAGFRARKIEIDDWSNPATQVALSAIRHQLEDREERPALPILPGDGTLGAVHEALDGLQLSAVQRAALRAFNAVAFWGGGRASEVIRHLRWKHVAVAAGDRSRFRMTWPEGCKFQTENVTLIRGTGLVADPLEALERLRCALADAGVVPTPEDAVFPDVARDRVVLSPCDNVSEDERARWGDDAEAAKREAVTAWYRRWWCQAAGDAGLVETATRRLSPHGLRRGLATAAALAGVPVIEIQAEMRHGNWAVTLRYTDEQRIDMSEVVALIDSEDDVSDVDPTAVARLATQRTAGGSDDGRCGVVDDDGGTCVRPAAEYQSPYGHVCTRHADRIRKGYRVTRPMPAPVDPSEIESPSGTPVEREGTQIKRCAAAGCPNTTPWRRFVAGRFLWFCQEHARAHALDPAGTWDALRVCDGLGCDQTYGQRRRGVPTGALMDLAVGDRTLKLCSRCWTAARRATDPEDHASWARRPTMPSSCQLCDDGTAATSWITDGPGTKIGACGAHYSRWADAGRPDRLDDGLRVPVDRSRASDHECVLCQDGTIASSWISEDTERLAACGTHYERWRCAGKPDRMPAELRAPVPRR